MKNLTLVSIFLFVMIIITIFVYDIQTKNLTIIPRENNLKIKPIKDTTNHNKNTNIFLTKTASTNKQNAGKTKTNIKQFKSPNINLLNLKNQLEYTQPGSGMSFSEVMRHNIMSDCYLVINSNVYNVTPYMPLHPAGSRIIAKYCGGKVTGIFAQIHSNRAWDLLKHYKLGSISNEKLNVTPQILSSLSKALSKTNPDATIIKISPKVDGYVAKAILNDSFYELHIDKYGQIYNEEAGDTEINWRGWDTDYDDN